MKIKINKYKPLGETSIETEVNGKWEPIYIESKDEQKWICYDINGNIIHYRNNKKDECFYEYNSKNKIIHIKPNYRTEFWIVYNKKGEEIGYKLKRWGRLKIWG